MSHLRMINERKYYRQAVITLVAWMLAAVFAIQDTDATAFSRLSSDKALSVDQMLLKLKDRLDLDWEQIELMRPLLEDDIARKKGVAAGVGKSQVDRTRVAARVREINSDTRKKMAEILTCEQLEDYDKYMEELNNSRGFGRSGGRGRGGVF